MSYSETTMTDADRLVLSAVMDLIVPAVDDLPGAGEMGLAFAAEDACGSGAEVWGVVAACDGSLVS